MRDPHDSRTLDLVEAAKRPLTAAERQKRHREKKKREREEGRRIELSLQAGDVALLREVLKGCRGRRGAVDLLLRLPDVPVADSRSDASEASDSWPAHSVYQVGIGYVAPGVYRQTPAGQPEVDSLVKPGDVVWTSYDSGPYLVKAVRRIDYQVSDQHDLGGLHSFSLAMKTMDGRGADCGINELVAMDGRLLKLFANNDDEVFVAGTSARDGHAIKVDSEALREALANGEAAGRALLEQLRASGAQAAPVAQAAPAGEEERDYRLSEDEVVSLLTCISAFLTIRADLNYSLPRKIAEKLAAGTRWAEYGTNIGPDQGVISILDQLKGEAKRWQKHYDELFDQQRRNAEQAEAIAAQRREAELGQLRRELEALRREKDLLEAERCGAFAANRVLSDRLRDAGLSTEYR